MPLTPFHFGPAFVLWLAFRKHLNLAAVLIGSAIVDTKAFICYFFLNCETHDPIFHSFFGALWLALVVLVVVLLLQSHIKNLTDSLKISDNYNIKAIFIGALVGTFSHIIFDVCAHSNILAFWPISSQPFAIPLSLPINLFAILLTFVAVFWFASRFVFHQK